MKRSLRTIPLLDQAPDKVQFLRDQIAAQYEHSPLGSKYPDRVASSSKRQENGSHLKKETY
jgi:hypothetical protein